ncbi:MAG: hypothetical protein MHPSP_002668, partial [Paramarteilia canceri]
MTSDDIHWNNFENLAPTENLKNDKTVENVIENIETSLYDLTNKLDAANSNISILSKKISEKSKSDGYKVQIEDPKLSKSKGKNSNKSKRKANDLSAFAGSGSKSNLKASKNEKNKRNSKSAP